MRNIYFFGFKLFVLIINIRKKKHMKMTNVDLVFYRRTILLMFDFYFFEYAGHSENMQFYLLHFVSNQAKYHMSN